MSSASRHYLGHRQRLRERFLKPGLGGFADHEVVELLLTLAIPRHDVKERAKALIARFGDLRGILRKFAPSSTPRRACLPLGLRERLPRNQHPKSHPK